MKSIIEREDDVVHADDECKVSNVIVEKVALQCRTRGQRFKAIQNRFSNMASMLSELPPNQFAQCLMWIQSLENKIRDGLWRCEISSCDDGINVGAECEVVAVADEDENEDDVVTVVDVVTDMQNESANDEVSFDLGSIVDDAGDVQCDEACNFDGD